MSVDVLAAGKGWRATSQVCTAGPDDPPVGEVHDSVCVAAVLRGTFQYRTAQGSATLVPGAVLLGNHRCSFECSHDHESGDHCVAFHYDPGYFEEILRSLRGVKRLDFALSRLPPIPVLSPRLAVIQSAMRDPSWLAEVGLNLAADVAALAAEGETAGRQPSRRDVKRIADIVRLLEENPPPSTSLDALAQRAGMSPYHFLRVFRDVTGTTPHQFVLATKLRWAAIRLNSGDEPISTIAFDVGFNDLSEFNRRFRRFASVSPSVFRVRGLPAIQIRPWKAR